MITCRVAILSLLALAGLQAAAQAPPAADGLEVSGPSRACARQTRPEGIDLPFQTLRSSMKAIPGAGFSVRRSMTRRKEESPRRPLRREWGSPAAFRVSQEGAQEVLEGFAPDLSFVSHALVRKHDDDRGPPSPYEEGCRP